MTRVRQSVHFPGLLMIVLFVLLQTLNHVLFKIVALGPGGASYLELFFDPLFYVSGLVFFFQFIVWIMVLRHYPLSFAYPLTSTTLIAIIASGAFFFNESVTLGNLIGAVLIIIGVIVISGEKINHHIEGNGRA